MDNEVDALLRQQEALRSESDALEHDLGLDGLLEGIGHPVRVGSAALGLMVWRDFDITVICTKLDIPLIAALGARLLNHPRIQQVLLRDDTGAWNTDPTYPDGVYLGLEYRSPAGRDWKVDIWFVDDPDRQPDLGHLRTIPPHLNAETRAAILTIKAAWWARPEYRRTVKSLDIYTAVLRDGVRALADFDGWLATRTGED